MNVESFLQVLLRTLFRGGPLSVDTPTEAELESLCSLSKKHDLAHLAAHALENLDLPESEILNKFKSAKLHAIYRYARLEYEYERICRTLEAARIPFLPLKGSVIRQYYPEPWMRTSCDIDVLVREEDLDGAESALCGVGWTRKGEKAFHDISLYSQTGVHLELHFSILENVPTLDPVLSRVWDHVQPAEGKQYEQRMNSEFFLFHHLAHMSYHFLSGGCGIRPFLDLWLLKRHMSWNGEQLRRLCADAGLETFCTQAMALAEVWFGEGQHTAVTARMEEYVLRGGLYGNVSNRVVVNQAQSGGRWKNFWRRAFMPYYKMKVKYPILERHKWLLPVYHVVRWCQVLTRKRLKRALTEISLNQTNTEDQIVKTQAFLKDLGLL